MAGSGSDGRADAGSRCLHTVVRRGTPLEDHLLSAVKLRICVTAFLILNSMNILPNSVEACVGSPCTPIVPLAFHPNNRVFNADSNRRDYAIVCFLRWGEFTPTGFFLGLNDGDTGQDKFLESHILIEATPRRECIASQSGNALIRHLAFIGRTQETHVTGFVDHEEVFNRVAFLLAL
jgi:hypothetical protein